MHRALCWVPRRLQRTDLTLSLGLALRAAGLSLSLQVTLQWLSVSLGWKVLVIQEPSPT